MTEQEHRAMRPAGRAFLKGAPYTPPHEEPSADFPLRYTTGRTVYQFHTRTKTGRSGDLNRAAPDAWVEISPTDADARGIAEGDWVRVESPRGAIEVRARVGDVMEGAVFAPFHYGHWEPAASVGGGHDDATAPARQRAHHDGLGPGVEATGLQDRRLPGDPPARRRRPSPCATTTGHPHPAALDAARPAAARGLPTQGGGPTHQHHAHRDPDLLPRPGPGGPLMPHLTTYIGLADHSEQTLADSFRTVAEGHARAADVFHTAASSQAGPTTTARPWHRHRALR